MTRRIEHEGAQPSLDNLPDIRRPVLAGIVVVALALGGSVAWAGFTLIERGVLGQGRIAGISETQRIQHLEGGIIREVRVQEGQRVERGDALIMLDRTDAALRVQGLERRHANLVMQEERLLALRSGAQEMRLPEALNAAATKSPQLQEMLETQQRLFEAERSVIGRSHRILQQRIEQQNALLASLRERSKAQQEELDLVMGRIADVEALAKKGYAPKTHLVDLGREKAALTGTQADLLGRTAQTEEAINEIASQIAAFDYRSMERWSEEAAKIKEEREQVHFELVSAQERLRRREIVAPTSGTVMNLRYVTEGGVVAPGDVLMEIVPHGAVHLVDVRVEPRDIERARPGQAVRVRLSGLSQRTVPVLSGVVTRISPDTLVDERSGEAYYKLRIKMAAKEIEGLGVGESLQPGMPAEVVLVSEKTTVLQALLEPVSAAVFRTLRQ